MDDASSHIRVFRPSDSFKTCRLRGDYDFDCTLVALVKHLVVIIEGWGKPRGASK
jgi:hypothetical protein